MEGVEILIGIVNIYCASCSQFIEEELFATPGVVKVSVNLTAQEALVEYFPEKTYLAQLNDAIQRWGYCTHYELNESDR